MLSRCRFTECDWTGDSDNLYDHCELNHQGYIRDINTGNRFVFTFDEILQTETFLLRGNCHNLYWLTQNKNDEDDGFSKGLFAVDNSEILDYRLKIGSATKGYVKYFGPFEVQPENSNYFQIFFSFEFVEYINKSVERKMTLFLGEYDENDDDVVNNFLLQSLADALDVTSDNEQDEINSTDENNRNDEDGAIGWDNDYYEKFTCSICLEYIRVNARFCANRHFLCNNCYEELSRRDNLRCPVCRGDFLNDTQSEDVEILLKSLQFPE